MIAWTLFYNPLLLRSDWTMLLVMLPLCLAVAVVYKTVRTRNLRRLPIEILVLMGLMTSGLAVLGAALYFLQAYWP